MFNGMDYLLIYMRYIPELKRNLISLGTLDRSGYGFSGKIGIIKISKGSMIVIKWYK